MDRYLKSQCTDRHKQVECKVCLQKMRSSHLKRHMLKHRDLCDLDEDEIREEIKWRKKLRKTREEREVLVIDIAGEEGFPTEYLNIKETDALPSKSIEKELLDDDRIYSEKLERGKVICSILEKGSVREDSLSKKNKESLELYRKQMSTRSLLNVELRT